MIELINYNWMPTVANHVWDASPNFYAAAGVSRLHNHVKALPENIREDDILFVKTDYLYDETFQTAFLPRIKKRFTLVTGISSYNVQGKEAAILNSEKVKHWFCTNPPDINDKKIIPLPIGFEEKERAGGNQDVLNNAMLNAPEWLNKSDKLYLPYHDVGTNPQRDAQIRLLSSLDYVEVETERLEFSDYLNKMSNYKYVLCLSGAGDDTHRNYEVLLVGSTPVMLTTPLKKVFDFYNLPSIFLKEWAGLGQIYESWMLKNKYHWDVTEFLNVNTHKERILSYAKN
tara:strand:- start:172 stop:1029 length:858 start_codon:yes stop_codon:yes gene_type:complete